MSGAYIGSDMNSSQGNREFTEKILKYGYQSSLLENRSGNISGLGKNDFNTSFGQRKIVCCYKARLPGSFGSGLFSIQLICLDNQSRWFLKEITVYAFVMWDFLSKALNLKTTEPLLWPPY